MPCNLILAPIAARLEGIESRLGTGELVQKLGRPAIVHPQIRTNRQTDRRTGRTGETSLHNLLMWSGRPDVTSFKPRPGHSVLPQIRRVGHHIVSVIMPGTVGWI